jgi:hypothetical protein
MFINFIITFRTDFIKKIDPKIETYSVSKIYNQFHKINDSNKSK